MSKSTPKKTKSIKSLKDLAQWISLLENSNSKGFSQLKKLYSQTGHSLKIGITGSPGVGKSTLIDKLIGYFRKDGKSIAITAIDPTSPVSGGALLGDRIRMQQHSSDKNVFIRSLATREHRGGVTSTIRPILHALDIYGFDIILIETVGTGQDEVEIQDIADLTIVVFGPGSGDSIQFAKSGIVDIGDILVVNKSDITESDQVLRELQMRYHFKPEDEPIPKILSISSKTETGIDTLYRTILDTSKQLSDSGELDVRRHEQATTEVIDCLKNRAIGDILSQFYNTRHNAKLVGQLQNRKTDPYTISERIYKEWMKK